MVSQMVESIAAAAEEQRHAGDEVSRAIQEIAGASRQATDAVSQGAQTAQDLSERATELRSLISRFRTN
jgi:methyl-accepting chemotaxis protein